MNKENNIPKDEIRILLLYLLKSINFICEKENIPYYASAGTCLGALRHKGLIPWDDDIDIMIPRKYYNIFVEKCQQYLKSPIKIRTRENDPYFCCEYIKICFQDDVLGYSDLSIDVFFLDETDPERKVFRFFQNEILTFLYFIKKYKVSQSGKGEQYVPKNIFKRVYIHLLSSFFSLDTIDKFVKKIMLSEKKIGDFWVNWGSCYSYKKATYPKKSFGTPQKAPYENTYIYIPENPSVMLTQLYGEDYMTPPPPHKRKNHNVAKIACKVLNIEKIRKEIGL